MKNILKNEGGSLLMMTLVFSLILSFSVVAFLNLTKTQFVQVNNQLDSTRAFYIAESALELTMKVLREDFQYTPYGTEPSWADETLYGPNSNIDLTRGGIISAPVDYPDFYPLFDETEFPYYRDADGQLIAVEQAYKVELSNVQGRTDRIWIKATGTYDQTTRTIFIMLRARNIFPWNNAIFAAEGQNGMLINGNVQIAGSVHLLGESLSSFDYAMDLSGTAFVQNNYSGLPLDLLQRVPSIALPYGGDLIDDLEAEVRIKRGLLGLSGTAHVGLPEIVGNNGKETVMGVYITHGYGGNQGPTNVHSDNGTRNRYDCSEHNITFPKVTEPYTDPNTGIDYSSYIEYLETKALVISNPAQLNQLSNITPDSSFSFQNANGRISMDGNGNLTVSGIVVIEGDLGFNKKGDKKKVYYEGKAAILATGNINMNINFLTKWYNTYPQTDFIGFMTPADINFNEAQINVMGVFYAENQITCSKQTNVTGTFFSNYFNMGTNVPAIFQVPETARNLPDGMIGADKIWIVQTATWREI